MVPLSKGCKSYDSCFSSIFHNVYFMQKCLNFFIDRFCDICQEGVSHGREQLLLYNSLFSMRQQVTKPIIYKHMRLLCVLSVRKNAS